jgi:putative SOS response-associated peptidase YedK
MTLTRRDLDEVADELGVLVADNAAVDYRPRFNVAPTDRHIILRPRGEASPGADEPRNPPVLAPARWGFPRAPGNKGALHINARAETAPFRAAFREAFVQRRCAVPADGFFEWLKPGGTGAGQSAVRQPVWFHRPDGHLLLFAGLYEDVPGPEGKLERRFVVLTTAANALVAPVHDRMPAILSREEAALWLDKPAQSLLRPAPADLLVATLVSKRVNSVKNDDPGCLVPDPAPDGDKPHSGGQLGLFGPI